jgi:putative ABC transport system permease protein
MIIAGFGVVLGGLVAIQTPIVPGLSFLSFPVVLAALALAAAFMLLLAAGCGLYPGWMATRIHPAEALHYE